METLHFHSLPLTNGTVRQQDASFESVCVFSGARLAAHKTTATLKGALGPQVNNSVSLVTLHIYSLEISALKISCCGWGEVASSHILSGPKYSRDLSSCVPEEFTLGDRCGKRGVRFISADEKKQKQRVSSFPRWVAQRGGRERCRHATSPWMCRHLGLTPLAILVLSAVTDTITKCN